MLNSLIALIYHAYYHWIIWMVGYTFLSATKCIYIRQLAAE